MDAHTFDRWTMAVAQRPTRRCALRLLAAGIVAALPAHAGAQRPDRDEDGLYDDDEEEVYGTDPDDWDTDDDNIGDGEEIYNRDQGLGGNTDPLVNENAAPPPADPAPPPADNGGAPPAATCTATGGACSSNMCCQPDPNYTYAQCCFDANGAGICTDVAALGTFLCPDPGEPVTGCPAGQTNCGGVCTDLLTDHGNCGACGTRCSQVGEGYNCVSGACAFYCLPGLSGCNGVCVDLLNDPHNCGFCGNVCTGQGATIPGTGETIPIIQPSCSNGLCSLPPL